MTPSDTVTFDLPPVLKLEECQQLHAFLLESVGTPVTLNCAAVTRLGGLPAQLITMAARAWAVDDISLQLADPSDGFRESLQILGLDTLLDGNEVMQ